MCTSGLFVSSLLIWHSNLTLEQLLKEWQIKMAERWKRKVRERRGEGRYQRKRKGEKRNELEIQIKHEDKQYECTKSSFLALEEGNWRKLRGSNRKRDFLLWISWLDWRFIDQLLSDWLDCKKVNLIWHTKVTRIQNFYKITRIQNFSVLYLL